MDVNIVYGRIIVATILGIIGIAALGFVYSTIKLGQKLIGQFKCEHCNKYNKVLVGKCTHCSKTMTRGKYKYKSSLLGKVTIKNKSNQNELKRAIKWIVVDAVYLSAIALGSLYFAIKTLGIF